MTQHVPISPVDYTTLGSTFRVDASAACSLCGCSAGRFKDYNGRPKALCGDCNAAESTRVFADVYRNFIAEEYPLDGKRILHVAPSGAEGKFVKSLQPLRYVSADARPEAKTDLVVDICRMPSVATESFDAVIACGVSACLHDLDGAMREIERILVAGGVFLHCEVNYAFNSLTIALSGDDVTAWYGREALERHRVGQFHRIGDLDFIARLQQRFVVKTFYGRDAVNGLTVVWHCAVKRPDALLLAGTSLPVLPERTIRFGCVPPSDSSLDFIGLDVTVPHVPDALRYSTFGGHQGEDVFLCAKGVIGHSRNLGATFDLVRPAGLEHIEFDQCFVTSAGTIIAQAIGWRDKLEKRTDVNDWGSIFTFDRSWRLLSRTKLGDSSWHGSWSIDEGDGVVMLAEYPNNAILFRPGTPIPPDEARWLRPARIWRSRDGGVSWEVSLRFEAGAIRHIHTVLHDPTTPGTWWATTGDLPGQSQVWRSTDHGATWQDATARVFDASFPGGTAHGQASQRLTAMDITSDQLLWVGDDLMAPYWDITPDDFRAQRAGAWIFSSPKTIPLQPRPIARIGNAGRSMTDVGPGYIATTEAKRRFTTLNPQISSSRKMIPRAQSKSAELPVLLPAAVASATPAPAGEPMMGCSLPFACRTMVLPIRGPDCFNGALIYAEPLLRRLRLDHCR